MHTLSLSFKQPERHSWRMRSSTACAACAGSAFVVQIDSLEAGTLSCSRCHLFDNDVEASICKHLQASHSSLFCIPNADDLYDL